MNQPIPSPETAAPCGQREAICYTVVDLFSGIGGFSLGLERTGGFKTTAFCEIEPYPRKILRKHWPDVPIFEDVRKLHAEDLPCKPDVITGGYPCQPFSVAGKRRGAKDDRHLWPEIMRLIQELDAAGKKPTWCIFENVAGHISMGLDQVLADLEGADYTCWPLVIPACALNAPHRRDRVWIIANSGSERAWGKSGAIGNKKRGTCKSGRKGLRQIHGEALSGRVNTTGGDVANTCGARWKECNLASQPGNTGHASGGDNKEISPDPSCKLFNRTRDDRQARRTKLADSGDVITNTDDQWELQPEGSKQDLRRWFGNCREWTTECPVRRRDDGLPENVARLKALGNAVVPQIPEMIGWAILNV